VKLLVQATSIGSKDGTCRQVQQGTYLHYDIHSLYHAKTTFYQKEKAQTSDVVKETFSKETAGVLEYF
jgi:hypothetical protein